jgi:hypothetical protein
MTLDLIPMVSDDNHRILNAGLRNGFENVFEKSAAANRQQSLGPAHSFGFAGGEDDRSYGHINVSVNKR